MGIWRKKIWPSGVSPKRASKMQLRDVDLRSVGHSIQIFFFFYKKRKKKKATNYGKSLVASSLTCPLKIPCQRNGHQSLHSGFNIDCLGEKVLRLRLVVVVESTPQLEQAAWRGEVGEGCEVGGEAGLGW